MKLSTKMYLGFAIPAFILAGVGTYSLYAFKSIDRQIGTIYDDRVIPLNQLKVISDQYAITIIDAVNKADANLITLQEALQQLKTAEQAVQSNWQAYLKTELTPTEQKLVAEAEVLFVQVNQEIAALEQALQAQDSAGVARFNGRLYAVIDPLTAKLHELTDLQLQVAQQERQKAEQVYQSTVSFFILLLIAALVVASPLGFLVSRSIIATLKETINTLSKTATEIATATEQQERLAAQQATSVSQTTATMDELNSSSQQSAAQAKESSFRANQAFSQSESGMKAVEETLTGMQVLQQKVEAIANQTQQLKLQTDQIGAINALVSDLANQTNMLALNAAVEAARSGEQGKGFSVIATEIRKLSNQSKVSAEKINNLIADIQTAIQATVTTTEDGTTTVQSGMQLTQNTVNAFNSIMQEIQGVVVSSQQISLTSNQQAIAVQQVVAAMNSLNIAAQENASGIRQTKLGTQTLNETAEQLAALV